MDGSEWSVEDEKNVVGDENAKQMEESHSKIALLEVIQFRHWSIKIKCRIWTWIHYARSTH
jgi:hypothetical protein